MNPSRITDSPRHTQAFLVLITSPGQNLKMKLQSGLMFTEIGARARPASCSCSCSCFSIEISRVFAANLSLQHIRSLRGQFFPNAFLDTFLIFFSEKFGQILVQFVPT